MLIKLLPDVQSIIVPLLRGANSFENAREALEENDVITLETQIIVVGEQNDNNRRATLREYCYSSNIFERERKRETFTGFLIAEIPRDCYESLFAH